MANSPSTPHHMDGIPRLTPRMPTIRRVGASSKSFIPQLMGAWSSGDADDRWPWMEGLQHLRWIQNISGGFKTSQVDLKHLRWIQNISGGFKTSQVDLKHPGGFKTPRWI